MRYKQEWYAVYTRPRLEKNVHERIAEMGVESFLPTHEVVRVWSDRKKKVKEPLFPNYVFVKTSKVERFNLFAIPGLVRFITQEGQPVVIPDLEIDSVKSVMSSNCSLTCEPYSGRIGSKVLIKNGQFSGISGVIEKQNGKRRLIIQIEALKQLVSVDISTANVELMK